MIRGLLAACCIAAIVVTLLIWPPTFTEHAGASGDQTPPVGANSTP